MGAVAQLSDFNDQLYKVTKGQAANGFGRASVGIKGPSLRRICMCGVKLRQEMVPMKLETRRAAMALVCT